MEPVLVDRREGVATVSLSRPERRDALDMPFRDTLRAALLDVTVQPLDAAADHANAVSSFLAKERPVLTGR